MVAPLPNTTVQFLEGRDEQLSLPWRRWFQSIAALQNGAVGPDGPPGPPGDPGPPGGDELSPFDLLQIANSGIGVTSVTSANADLSVANPTTTPVLTINSAPKLDMGRTIAITGDLAYTSPAFDGSANVTAAGTLATVNANVGSFTNANITVNAKGLITAAANGSLSPNTSWFPLTSGTEPPNWITNGAGVPIAVSYTP